MITIYTQPGCSRCRRLKRWLKDSRISYKDEQLYALLLRDEKLLDLLACIEDPTLLGDLDSNIQPALLPDGKPDLEGWKKLYQQNPSALRRPLVFFGPEDSPQEYVDLYHYLTYGENASCSSCSMVPVCRALRDESDAAYLYAPKEILDNLPEEQGEEDADQAGQEQADQKSVDQAGQEQTDPKPAD